MIAFDELITRTHAIEADAEIEIRDNYIRVTIEDFIGFNANWEEEFRDYEDPEAVDTFIEWLEANADYIERNFYIDYHFNDIRLRLGYTSFDI